jgi:large subunit ribosomal protein L32
MHLGLKVASLVRCAKCGALNMPHRVCSNCGYYAGREVVDVLKKLDKKERKKRERVLREQEEQTGQEKMSN